MEILKFINSHENWESLLTSDPYNLKIKWEDNYFILTYDMIKTDFNIKLTHEARGSIFYKADDGKITCVCRPFTKFFNYGEPYAAKIDWVSAHITEKIDGSLIKFWYHNGKWHMSTNGCIDAFKASTATDATFGQLVQKEIFNPLDWEYFADHWLSIDKTHLFEFTSPDNQVVLKYPKASLWYLTSIGITGEESFELEPKELMNSAFKCEIVFPRQFDLKTLDDVIEQAEMLGEGCVVSDKFNNRIKVKSTDYVLKHKFLNNKKIDEYAIAWYIKESRIDDFYHYSQSIMNFMEMLSKKFVLEVIE